MRVSPEHEQSVTHSFVINQCYCSAIGIGDISDGGTVELLDLLNNLLLIIDKKKTENVNSEYNMI